MAGYAKAIALAAITVSSAFIMSLFAIPSLNSPAPMDGGAATAEAHRIVVITRLYEDPAFKHVKASDSDMEANSMQLVADPFGRSMKAFHDRGVNNTLNEEEKISWLRNVDAHEKYMLVRLPEWLGGSKNDLSAYRVFSALDIMSQCNIGYRDTRAVIEDPCHGNTYRPWDGLVVRGVSAYGASGANAGLFTSSILALPQIRIGLDDEGYIVAYKLDNTLNGDGVVGEGKRLTPEELDLSNEKMLQAASAYAGFDLPLPADIVGNKHLIYIAPVTEKTWYPDISFEFGHDFGGRDRLFSAMYGPRPLTTGSQAGFVISIFSSELEESQAKATFDSLFGAESPECDQGCRFIIEQGENMIVRVDTEAGANMINAEALVWGDGEIMAAIEGINSDMEDLLSVVASLHDHGL